jgi:hypothetical protein
MVTYPPDGNGYMDNKEERKEEFPAPEIDSERYRDGFYVEPLPESTRPRKDGPGGN